MPHLPNPLRWLSRLAAIVLIALVRVYQLTLSPIIGGQCKYLPTCSQYFIEAVQKRGPVVGLGMGLWRLMRCHPWGKGGYDPVKPGKDSRP